MLRRALLFLSLTFIFSLVWASSSEQLSLSVSAGNANAGGAVAVVESISQNVTVTLGKAQRTSGVTIFNISRIAPGAANLLLIHMILVNPQDIVKVLGNPNAYINVTVSNSSSTPGEIYVWDILSKERAEVFLKPQNVPVGTRTIYIQVSITVPGGPPAGQQGEDSLNYYCRVDLRSGRYDP